MGQYVAGIFIKTKKATFFRNELNHLPQAAPERFTQKKKEQPTWKIQANCSRLPLTKRFFATSFEVKVLVQPHGPVIANNHEVMFQVCEVCGLDDRLRLLAGIGDQQSVFFSYHFRKVFLCFGILAAEQNGKLKVAQHSFPFVFAVNHIEVGQGLSQHHNTDVTLS